MRFVRTLALVSLVAAVVVSVAGALSVTDASLRTPVGAVGTPYHWQFEAYNGCKPYTFHKISGDLPPGLVLSDEGTITGTPTQGGSFFWWLQTVDNCGFKTEDAITTQIMGPLKIANESLPAGTLNTPYSVTLTTIPVTPVTWSVSVGALPPGLALDPSTGVISGTPTTVGSWEFTVKASDKSNPRSGTSPYRINIVTPLVFDAPTLPAGEVGITYSAAVSASGGLSTSPYVWSIGSGTALPPGLAIDPATGAITGTPTSAGTFPFKITVTDALNSSLTRDVKIVVAATPVIVTARLAPAKVGRKYSAVLAASGGSRPLSWRLNGSLPPGVRFNRDTRVLSGKPTKAGRYQFTATVTDALGVSATKTFLLVVKRRPDVI